MKNSLFAFSFDKKPDPRQWEILKNKLPPGYTVPDIEMLSNIHRSRIPLEPLNVQEWLNQDHEMTWKEEEERINRIKHLLPEEYVIPDLTRLKNILMK